MTKAEFEIFVAEWAIDFIRKDSDLEFVDVFINKNISRVNDKNLNSMESTQHCDFICDFVFLVKHNVQGLQLILINRFVDSVGIKNIGEMLVYAKIAKPIYAFLISYRGHSAEINKILVNESISTPLFKYDVDKSVVLFALREGGVIEESVLPLSMRDFIYKKISCI